MLERENDGDVVGHGPSYEGVQINDLALSTGNPQWVERGNGGIVQPGGNEVGVVVNLEEGILGSIDGNLAGGDFAELKCAVSSISFSHKSGRNHCSNDSGSGRDGDLGDSISGGRASSIKLKSSKCSHVSYWLLGFLTTLL
jgi:hypothetical protein